MDADVLVVGGGSGGRDCCARARSRRRPCAPDRSRDLSSRQALRRFTQPRRDGAARAPRSGGGRRGARPADGGHVAHRTGRHRCRGHLSARAPGPESDTLRSRRDAGLGCRASRRGDRAWRPRDRAADRRGCAPSTRHRSRDRVAFGSGDRAAGASGHRRGRTPIDPGSGARIDSFAEASASLGARRVLRRRRRPHTPWRNARPIGTLSRRGSRAERVGERLPRRARGARTSRDARAGRGDRGRAHGGSGAPRALPARAACERGPRAGSPGR